MKKIILFVGSTRLTIYRNGSEVAIDINDPNSGFHRSPLAIPDVPEFAEGIRQRCSKLTSRWVRTTQTINLNGKEIYCSINLARKIATALERAAGIIS